MPTYEATDPKTGQKWTWDGKKWNPAVASGSLTAPDNPLDPVTGKPKAGVLSRYLQSTGAAAMSLPSALKQTFTGDLTPEEARTYLGHEASEADIKNLKKRLLPGELSLERLSSLPLVGAAQGYKELKPSWEAIKSVLPEALGGGTGTVAAGEAAGAAGSATMKNVVAPPTKSLLRNIFGAGKRDIERSTSEIAAKQDKTIDAAQKKVDAAKEKYSDALAEREQKAKEASAKQTAAETRKQALETQHGPVAKRMNEMADAAQAHISEIEQKVGKQESAKWEAFKEKMDNPTVRTGSVVGAIEQASEGLAGENVPIFKSVLKEIAEEDPLSQASVFKSRGGAVDMKEMLAKAAPAVRDRLLRDLEAQGFTEESGFMSRAVDLPLDNARALYTRIGRVLNSRELPRPVARAITQVHEALDSSIAQSIVKEAGAEGLREYRGLQKDYRQYRETFSDRDSPLRRVTEAKDPKAKLNPITGDTGQRAVDYLGRYRSIGAKPEVLGKIRALHKALRELPSGGGKVPGEVEKPSLPQVPERNVPSAEELRRQLLTKRGMGISAMPSGMMFFSPRGVALRLLARTLLRNKGVVDWLAKDKNSGGLSPGVVQ